MKKYLMTLMAWGMLLGMGCASTEPARVGDRKDPYLQKGRIQWNSSKLKHSLRIDTARADRTETGLLKVRVILRNKTARDIVVDIRTLFTDDVGFEKEKTNWEAIVCTARTQTEYETVSLGSAVTDYQVIIRDPRDFSFNP